MNRSELLHNAAKAAAITVALMCATEAAVARAADQAAVKEIVVEAPRSSSLPTGRSAFGGAPTAVTIVKIPVLYGDLDLSKPAHAARLMLRIDRVAQDACRYLDRLFPLSPDTGCIARAVENARVAATAKIAAAGQ